MASQTAAASSECHWQSPHRERKKMENNIHILKFHSTCLLSVAGHPHPSRLLEQLSSKLSRLKEHLRFVLPQYFWSAQLFGLKTCTYIVYFLQMQTLFWFDFHFLKIFCQNSCLSSTLLYILLYTYSVFSILYQLCGWELARKLDNVAVKLTFWVQNNKKTVAIALT